MAQPELELDQPPLVTANSALNSLTQVTLDSSSQPSVRPAIEDLRNQPSPPDRAPKFSPAWFEEGCAAEHTASGEPANASIEACGLIDRVGGEPVWDSLEAE